MGQAKHFHPTYTAVIRWRGQMAIRVRKSNMLHPNLVHLMIV
jgi:hypothetical protein